MYERFAQLLQEKNITPYRVSKETGVTQTTLSDWKTGRATPKIATLQKIADYFNVSLDWLTGENIEFDFFPREFEDNAEIKCPICGDNNVHFQKTMGVNFNNGKSNGIAIKFWCEAKHFFYYVFETYKGNTYAVQTDGSTVVKTLDEPIYENAPIPLSGLWNEDKFNNLDEYGKDMVDTVLEKEYQRCISKKNTQTDISSYTQNIAAGTGSEGFDDNKINEVNDFAKKISELENNS